MPDHKVILDKGKFKKVSKDHPVDYTIPHGSDFFSAATNLIPSMSGISGGRIMLGDKAAIQAISLVNREVPLVQATAHEDLPSFEEQYGKKLASVHSPVKGTVHSITDHAIEIKDHEGKLHTLELYHNFNSGRKSFLHNTPVVNKGDEVKKGTLLATSNFSDKDGNLALGVNLETAIMPYRGSNYEDAFVVTESGAKKLGATQLVTHKLEKRMGIETKKDTYVSLFPNRFNNAQLQHIDADGVIKKGTILSHGDPVILAYAPKAIKTTDIHLGKLSKALKHANKDMTDSWDYDSQGEVTDVFKQGNLISVSIKMVRPLNVGDKLSCYSGNKGVTGMILPDTQAPTTKDGKPVDLILNSMSITTRVSPALIANLGIGKVAKKLGKPIKIKGFNDHSAIKHAQELMAKHDITDIEDLYDPVTGSNIKAVVGPLFINRLVHIAEDKVSDRAQGIGYSWDMQPTKAANESSKRLGNLSTVALLSHGAEKTLKDIAVVRATKNDEFWRRLKLGQPAPAPVVPFIFNKFIASLEGAGIKVARDGDHFQLLPQTDKDVMATSSGPVLNPKTFKVKGDNLLPEKGGLFDPNIVGILGTNYNHIDLHNPVPNPISEDYLRRLLKLTKLKYEDAIGSGELAGLLSKIDVDKTIEDCKKYIRSGKVSDRDNAVKLLEFLNNLKAHNLHPRDLMLSKIPVIPAQYRPVQVAGDLTLSANANHLYKDLMLNNMSLPIVDKLDNPDLKRQSRIEQYHAVKALYGLGDPISVKNAEKNVKGLLSELLGTHGGSAKASSFQAKVVNKPLDLVGRGVATGDVKLDLDDVSIPQDIAWKIFSPFLIRRLVRRGIPAMQAQQYIKDRNTLASQVLLEEMRDRPVIFSRDPALHKFNLMGFMSKINPDPHNKTLSVNPLVFKGFNLDLDGDQANLSTPASDDAKEEIKEKMLPSKNILSVRNFTPIYTPSNEAALGLYQMSSADNHNTPIHFDSEADAIKAFHNGKIGVADRVIIKK